MSVELLAPAGDFDALVAAVQNGADAVYLGAQCLNARAGAGNFDREGLRRAVDYAHERGARVHVTVNTLIKDGEEGQLYDVADEIAYAGADAAIVQDLGAAALLKAVLPSLPLHASTQMAIHNRQGAAFAREAGFDRVVLAREMSYAEIAECAREGIELEAFVHGALCVSCSGQCLFSSLIGGRSGNRGRCAQPCRLPYRLEGAVKGGGYLLSTKDLMSLDHLAELCESGVTSLKIEGRLKRREYVAEVTRVYREALDLLESYGEYEPDGDAREALLQIFNRGGFTQGYGPGLIDRGLMSPGKPNHAGFPVGELTAPGKIRLTRDVLSADTLAFRDKTGEEIEQRREPELAARRAAGELGVFLEEIGDRLAEADGAHRRHRAVLHVGIRILRCDPGRRIGHGNAHGRGLLRRNVRIAADRVGRGFGLHRGRFDGRAAVGAEFHGVGNLFAAVGTKHRRFLLLSFTLSFTSGVRVTCP